MDNPENDRVGNATRLLDSEKLRSAITVIDNSMEQPVQPETQHLVEVNPEYQTAIDASNMATQINTEMDVIHEYVQEHYHWRFPELKSLLYTPLEYCKCVKLLGNQLNVDSVNLRKFLSPATVMIVSVVASTTQGQQIADDEMAAVGEACDRVEKLGTIKDELLSFMKSRMPLLSPNLSAIVGPITAAKLISAAEGLTNLSTMPADCIELLGHPLNEVPPGLSFITALRNHGFIYCCDLIQSIVTTDNARGKASRLVARKCGEAARADLYRESPEGEVGRLLKEFLQVRLNKWQEPLPVVKRTKPALLKPEDFLRKKKGGRRCRKKEMKRQMSDIVKQFNKISIGKEVEEDASQGLDLSLSSMQVGKSTGEVPVPTADEAQLALFKRLEKRHKAQLLGGESTVKSSVAGTAAPSVVVPPLQEPKIANPVAAAEEKQDEEMN